MREMRATADELQSIADGNSQLLTLIAVSAVRSFGVPLPTYLAFIGQRLAPDWEVAGRQGARGVVRKAALAIVATGGELVACSGDTAHAEAVVAAWPSEGFLRRFRLSQTDADAFLDVFPALARTFALDLTHRRHGDLLTLRCARQPRLGTLPDPTVPFDTLLSTESGIGRY